LKKITEHHLIRKHIDSSPLVLLYFDRSTEDDVNDYLKKMVRFLKQFPRVDSYYIDLEDLPSASTGYLVYTFPTVLIYYWGKIKTRQEKQLDFQSFSRDLVNFSKQLAAS
jgi:hypothetical protein